MAPADIPDEWDFYPCRVEDAPAAISLNRWFERHPAPAGADTLYWVRIPMRSPGGHGMGDAIEADTTYALIDELADGVASAGLHYVGRLRNRGAWQLVFYGPPSAGGAVERACADIRHRADRPVEHGERPDAAWAHYRDFLVPDAERAQWMRDRRVVEALRDHGDPLTQRRRVDHWAHFWSAEGRDAYVSAAASAGFALEAKHDDGGGERPFGAQVHRFDSVQLEDIHAAVMILHGLAVRHGGSYDGWETSVER